MQDEPETRKCPLWVKIALAGSLALNLAIVGLVAGFILRGGPERARAPAMGYAIPYVLALPHEVRREVFGAVRRDSSLPDRRARRAEYREMIEALRATPFDVDAVKAVLERQATGAARVQAVAQAAWLDAVARLGPQERAAYVKRMEDALNRKGPSRAGDGANR